MTIVYIIGGIHAANGMSDVMTRKVNWLARHTDAQLYVVLTEGASVNPFYSLDPSVRVVNFGLDFDRLDTLPLWRKLWLYRRLMRQYRSRLTAWLMELRPDIVVSALRRDINFLTDIGDGSRKVGELHFARSSYRVFSRPNLPAWLCRAVTRHWQAQLIARLRRLDAFVVLSHEDAQAWPELKNLHVIPNSIRSLPAEVAPLTSRRVLAAGRYTEQKGFDLLLRSWAAVEAVMADEPWQLDIFGSGDAGPYVELARSLHLRHVAFHGATSDLQGEMLRSSVFAFSSRYEGFGLVLAEAMAAGLPVVSYACPCGPRDIVTHDADGLLVERVGDTDAFAQALLRLMRDASLRRRLASAAVTSARRFAEDNVMLRWQALFQGIT